MTIGVALFATTTQALSSGERRLHPFPWILAGEVMGEGDEVANQIFALSDPRNPRVLWKTGDPYESTIDFWLPQMQVDSVADEFELRSAAYEIGAHTTTEELCQDLEFADAGTEILTADPDVVDEFPIYCPDSTATVTLVPALG